MLHSNGRNIVSIILLVGGHSGHFAIKMRNYHFMIENASKGPMN